VCLTQATSRREGSEGSHELQNDSFECSMHYKAMLGREQGPSYLVSDNFQNKAGCRCKSSEMMSIKCYRS